jgi:hypothetical protein
VEEISVTLFVDYLLAVGRRRATVVRSHHREPFDTYALFKQAVLPVAAGRTTLEAFEARVAQLDQRRGELYPPLCAGLARFLRSKAVVGVAFFKPRTVFHGIEPGYAFVVNPELGFTNGAETCAVKLWCRTEPLTRERVELTCAVMQLAYEQVIPGIRAAVLDVRAGKLHESSG